MSELTTAARPYARAVFETANESKTLTEWSDSLAFMGAVADNEDVRRVLDNPTMTKQSIADTFIQFCDGKLNTKAENLAKLLAENGRLILLSEISGLYETLKSDAEGQIEAQVTSAQALSDDEQKAIVAALKKRLGRDVKLNSSVDETLMGGAIIRAGDLVIDGSLQGRLQKLTNTLNG